MFAVRRRRFFDKSAMWKTMGKKRWKTGTWLFQFTLFFFPTQFNLNMIAICTRNWRKKRAKLKLQLDDVPSLPRCFPLQTLNSININNAYRAESTIFIFDFQFRFVGADRQNRIVFGKFSRVVFFRSKGSFTFHFAEEWKKAFASANWIASFSSSSHFTASFLLSFTIKTANSRPTERRSTSDWRRSDCGRRRDWHESQQHRRRQRWRIQRHIENISLYGAEKVATCARRAWELGQARRDGQSCENEVVSARRDEGEVQGESIQPSRQRHDLAQSFTCRCSTQRVSNLLAISSSTPATTKIWHVNTFTLFFHTLSAVVEKRLIQPSCQRHRLSSSFIMKRGRRCYARYGVSSTDRQGLC